MAVDQALVLGGGVYGEQVRRRPGFGGGAAAGIRHDPGAGAEPDSLIGD